jgi:hypothetical protein
MNKTLVFAPRVDNFIGKMVLKIASSIANQWHWKLKGFDCDVDGVHWYCGPFACWYGTYSEGWAFDLGFVHIGWRLEEDCSLPF